MEIIDSFDHPFIVGIDLGTTNCAVSYVDLRIREEHSAPQIQIFNIPQLTNESEIRRLPMLPSFLYIPGEYEISRQSIVLPWGTQSDNFVGVFARDQGAKVPSRLVSSAKSWLCHDRVDRKAKILPWGDEIEVPRVSPVTASAAYLDHIRKAWNDFYKEEDLYLEHQTVIVTVPASFDEVARDLTLESATMAGLNDIILLEEPLSAFYSWLIDHEKEWHEHVNTDDLILVCDVGGGTTDFTLIALKEIDGNPGFERIAVGDHLILGGDNIDIALAANIESKTSGTGSKLSLGRWKSLCNQCRQAKEDILNYHAESKRITMMGQGSQLIAGTISVNLTTKEVEEAVINNFFPIPQQVGLALDDISTDNRPSQGISEFGLPFESDTAITHHLIRFLKRHEPEVKRTLNKDNAKPDFVLFNGGSLKPKVIQDRIIHSIHHTMDVSEAMTGQHIQTLENKNFDLAVARGAAYYGLVKIGQGVRVGSGSPRGYYLGVVEKSTDKERHPDIKKAICLIERGVSEGSKIQLTQNQFDVLANQPVVFELFSSSFRSGDATGDFIDIDDSLTRLPSLKTVVQYGKKGEKTKIPVHIEAEYTEVGTLAIWCRSLISPHTWRLQFDLRHMGTELDIGNATVFESTVIEKVCAAVHDIFSEHTPKSKLDIVVKEIAEDVGEKKDNWPLSLLRSIVDAMLDKPKARRIGPDHESRWLNLLGFCLRPGFGDGFDDLRIQKLWKIYGEGPIKDNHPQVRLEWWILWRRIAGGLNAGLQKQFVQDAGRLIMPKKGAPKKMTAQERLEIFMAVANMERIEVDQKIKWGRQLLSEIKPKKVKPQQLWSVSRFGARELLYGSTDRVVPVNEVFKWITFLITHEWKNTTPVRNAVVQMARKTGDRLRDIDEEKLKSIKAWLLNQKDGAFYATLLEKSVPMEQQEETLVFGESLPLGLIISKD